MGENRDTGSQYEKSGFRDEVDLYLDCMYELRRLCSFIQKYLSNRENLTKDNLRLTIEVVSLQYRKLFELIAMSSLVTNKRRFTKKHGSILKGYRPKGIMNMVKGMNPNFYPIPVELNLTDNSKTYNFVKREGVFLSEKELCRAWNLCSNYLHTNNPFKPRLEATVIMDSFVDWMPKIMNLYYNHAIQLFDSDKHFIVDIDFSQEKREIKIYYIWAK